MTEILPTGTCFDDALDLLTDILLKNPEDREELLGSLFLVHGITNCLGHESAHAWLEDDLKGHVLSVGLKDGERWIFAVPREEYYKEFQISERTRYSWEQVRELNLEHKTYGPWIERYQKLCSNTRKEAQG